MLQTLRSALRPMRLQELFLRWCELAAFTPVFRTHPGSYPDLNWQVLDFGKRRVHIVLFSTTSFHAFFFPFQFNSDEETLKFFSQMQVLWNMQSCIVLILLNAAVAGLSFVLVRPAVSVACTRCKQRCSCHAPHVFSLLAGSICI